MMIDINEYILLPLRERQKHLRLKQKCVERGGAKNVTSIYCRGLLAHLFDTSIPYGHKIYVCHACNNNKCSNPKHLYWGTASENVLDSIRNGKKTIWEFTVAKYGEKKARKLNAKHGYNGNKGRKKAPGPRPRGFRI